MKIFLKCFLCFCCLNFAYILQAQDILKSLENKNPGEGTVIIHQDSRINDLIGSPRDHQTSASSSESSVVNTNEHLGSTGRRSFKTNGYRLQVYAGNSTREAKEEAHKKALLAKEYLPGVAIYTYFLSPRWLCHVGDFRSIEEADAALRKLKATPYFKEVIIVREQVNVKY